MFPLEDLPLSLVLAARKVIDGNFFNGDTVSGVLGDPKRLA